MNTFREQYHKLGSLISAADNMASLVSMQINEIINLAPENEGQQIAKNINALTAVIKEIDAKVGEIKSVSYRFIDPDISMRDVASEMKKENSEYKILVVDDLQAICEAHRQFFERRGFKVFAAHDVASAIQSINDNAPNIVVLDLALPDYTEGLEVLSFLKKNCPETKCFIVTREDREEVLEEVRMANPYKIFVKPVDIAQLVAQINALIRKL